jgi:S-(hydroxymethyl)glutathione dehydrogenase / alcohol dehydrogenase
MMAAVCREFGKPLSVEPVTLAEPGRGEIRVTVRACGVCQSDLHYLAGAWGGDLPAVYGHEVAGLVDRVGSGVDALHPGQHVVVGLTRWCGRCFFCYEGEPALCETRFALDGQSPLRDAAGARILQGTRTGGFADAVVVHASQAVAIPDTIPFESACLLACAVITGFGSVVRTGQVRAGDRVVVIGTGGVGLNAVQAAAMAGAAQVIAIDISRARCEKARAFGATEALLATDDAEGQVRSMTGRRGADVVVVTAGASLAVEQGLRLVRRGGTVVVVGMPASGAGSRLDAAQMSHDGQRIVGSKMGSAVPQIDIPRLATLYQERRLKLDELVSRCYPLEQINDAISSAGRGEAIRNVIVFPQ